MPGGTQGSDDAAQDELGALGAARSKQDLEVVLTVSSSFELEENSIRELLETLGAHEALSMVEIPVGVDDPGVVVQLLLTVLTVPGHRVWLECLK